MKAVQGNRTHGVADIYTLGQPTSLITCVREKPDHTFRKTRQSSTVSSRYIFASLTICQTPAHARVLSWFMSDQGRDPSYLHGLIYRDLGCSVLLLH